MMAMLMMAMKELVIRDVVEGYQVILITMNNNAIKK